MGTKKHMPAFETAIAEIATTRENLAVEHFDVTLEYEAFEGDMRKKSGRLGRLEFTFETADVLNRNRRIYPLPVVAEAFAELNDRIQANQVFGRLDHPNPYDIDGMVVTLGDACVKVHKAELQGNKANVELHILDNPIGEQLMSTMKAGGRPATSQRAFAQWREPTDDEREKFKIPENEFAVVAERLRLITYDVVSRPGFAGAEDPIVSEHEGAKTMDLTELKTKHPALYEQVLAAGRAQASEGLRTQVDAAIEAAKPEIVREATESLIAERDAAKTRADELAADLQAIKPVLVKHGIVDEQITDEKAREKVAALETDLSKANETLSAALAEKAATEAKLAAIETERAIGMSLAKVRETHKDNKHVERIVDHVRGRNIADEAEALKVASEFAAVISEIMGTGTSLEHADPTGGIDKNTPIVTDAGKAAFEIMRGAFTPLGAAV